MKKINYGNLREELKEIAKNINPILEKGVTELTEEEANTLMATANKLYFFNGGVNTDEHEFIVSKLLSIDTVVNAYIKNGWKR